MIKRSLMRSTTIFKMLQTDYNWSLWYKLYLSLFFHFYFTHFFSFVGKIYVHCFKGVSRSATIVIAYLMLKCKMDLLEAVKALRATRKIHPNDGFIRQLCILNHDLGLDDIVRKQS